MSALKDGSKKSGVQTLYSPPRVIRIGDFSKGKGDCSGSGSGDSLLCTIGNNASGVGAYCSVGNIAADYCTAGDNATLGSCSAGDTAGAACSAGSDRT